MDECASPLIPESLGGEFSAAVIVSQATRSKKKPLPARAEATSYFFGSSLLRRLPPAPMLG